MAFVFLRHSIRALRKVQPDVNKRRLVGAMLIGIILVIGIPLALNWKTSEMVSNSIYTIIHSEEEDEINSATDTLISAFWCSDSCYDEIVWAYADEENETRRNFLEETYLKLTGENIGQRLWLLND